MIEEPSNTNHCTAGKTITPNLACYIASIAAIFGPIKTKTATRGNG